MVGPLRRASQEESEERLPSHTELRDLALAVEENGDPKQALKYLEKGVLQAYENGDVWTHIELMVHMARMKISLIDEHPLYGVYASVDAAWAKGAIDCGTLNDYEGVEEIREFSETTYGRILATVSNRLGDPEVKLYPAAWLTESGDLRPELLAQIGDNEPTISVEGAESVRAVGNAVQGFRVSGAEAQA